MQINSNEDLVQQCYSYLQFRYLLKKLSRNTNFLRYFKFKHYQQLAVIGTIEAVAKGEHLGAKCYQLSVLPLTDTEPIIVVVEELDYIQHCCKELNPFIDRKAAQGRKREVCFTSLAPGLDSNGKLKYIFSAGTTILLVSEHLKFQILKPLSELMKEQPTSEIDIPPQMFDGELIPLGDLRKVISTFCKTKYIVAGVLEIIRVRRQHFSDIYKTTTEALLHEAIYRSDQVSTCAFRLTVEVFHFGEIPQPDNELKNWHHYAVFNPEVTEGQYLDIRYYVKIRENRPQDNASKLYILEKKDQPDVLLVRNKSLKVTLMSQIPTQSYTRNIYKVLVIVSRPEIMIVRIVCLQCRRIKHAERCQLCNFEEFTIDLWAQCLAQDFSRCAYLNLDTKEVIELYKLNEQLLELLKQTALRCADNKLVVPGVFGKHGNKDLLPLYDHLKTLMQSRIVLATPFIDMHKTFRKTITVEQAVDLQIGFQTQRQFNETLKVFPNGTAVGDSAVLSLRVLDILSRTEGIGKLQ